MGHIVGKLRRAVFGISPNEASFSRRGFQSRSTEARHHLERAGSAFIAGYNAALDDVNPETLTETLNRHETEFVGFAFEGAAMGLMILDVIVPWRRRKFAAFLKLTEARHVYMVHIGAGWALARLKRNLPAHMAKLHPVLRWLVGDGYGFHQGFFHSERFVLRQEIAAELSGYCRRTFDQGLGRALWFVGGADVKTITAAVGTFEESRRADLYSGVGLASTYAGQVSDSELSLLRKASGRHVASLSQGAVFAAKARIRAGISTEYTDRACRQLTGLTALEAAGLADRTLEDLPEDQGGTPAYEVWRSRIQATLASKAAAS